jgi:hypothetical protein
MMSRAVARLVPGAGQVNVLLDVRAWPTADERKYLRDIGVTPVQYRRLAWAARRAALGWHAALVAMSSLSLGVLLSIGSADAGYLVGFFSAVTTASATVAALLLKSSLSARTRLLVSAARCARFVVLLGPHPPRGYNLRFLRDRVRTDRSFRRRQRENLAWAISRDAGRVNAAAPCSGGLGSVLLWFGDNPCDPRRRPTLSSVVVDVVAAAAGPDALIPTTMFAPAARFPTPSPRRRIASRLRDTAGGALVTGVLVAIVSAVLRIWFH